MEREPRRLEASGKSGKFALEGKSDFLDCDSVRVSRGLGTLLPPGRTRTKKSQSEFTCGSTRKRDIVIRIQSRVRDHAQLIRSERQGNLAKQNRGMRV